jgi:hypothetical protein
MRFGISGLAAATGGLASERRRKRRGGAISGTAEGFALGAGVAIAADFAVEPGSGDR